MTKQLEEQLFSEFAFFKPELPVSESLMKFGFECEDGWYDIIYSLCKAIQETNPPEDFQVIQVKEKFGSLRFYAEPFINEIQNMIDSTERKSEYTCELCGSSEGKLSKLGDYLQTLCINCFKRMKEEKDIL